MVEEGKPAPDFELTSDAGDTVRLADLRGKQVVLYFYPRDDTPGCTKQACGIRDAWDGFRETGARGVRREPRRRGIAREVQAEARSARSRSWPIPATSSTERYGFWVQKSFAGKKYMGVERSTVVIGADGVVEKVFRRVKPASHAAQVLRRSRQQLACSRLRRGVLIAAAALAALAAAPAAQPARGDGLVEVVVSMDAPPLAYAISKSRVLTGRAKAQRLDLRTPTSVGVPGVARDGTARARHQDHDLDPGLPDHVAVQRRPRRPRRPPSPLPARPPRRHAGSRARLAERRLPAAPRPQPGPDRRCRRCGACRRSAPRGTGSRSGSSTTGSTRPTRSSIRRATPCRPASPRATPPTRRAKVIAARAFPAPETTWQYAKLPFDPKQSEHATHVAGNRRGRLHPERDRRARAALRRRPARVHRQLQGAHLSDRELRPERERTRDRRRGRGGGQGRHGRDQPLARGGGDRPARATSSPPRSTQPPMPAWCP